MDGKGVCTKKGTKFKVLDGTIIQLSIACWDQSIDLLCENRVTKNLDICHLSLDTIVYLYLLLLNLSHFVYPLHYLACPKRNADYLYSNLELRTSLHIMTRVFLGLTWLKVQSFIKREKM